MPGSPEFPKGAKIVSTAEYAQPQEKGQKMLVRVRSP